MFQPHFEILLPAQKVLWPELAEVPSHFTLYGGTALALRLGHRESVDFDFFSSEQYNPMLTLKSLAYFGDGDLHKLTKNQKDQLRRIASKKLESLPQVRRMPLALPTK